jgi:hypothetical protein
MLCLVSSFFNSRLTVNTITDASAKLLRFVSDDVWVSKGVCRVISRSIAEYRNRHKYSRL